MKNTQKATPTGFTLTKNPDGSGTVTLPPDLKSAIVEKARSEGITINEAFNATIAQIGQELGLPTTTTTPATRTRKGKTEPTTQGSAPEQLAEPATAPEVTATPQHRTHPAYQIGVTFPMQGRIVANAKNRAITNEEYVAEIIARQANEDFLADGANFEFGEGVAIVTYNDRKLIRTLAEQFGVPEKAVAGQMAEAGAWAIRVDKVSEAMNTTMGNLVWQIINRDLAEFSHEIEVPELEDMFGISEDAKSFARTIPDFIGSLIHIGAKVINSPAAMREIISGGEFELRCKAAAAGTSTATTTPCAP